MTKKPYTPEKNLLKDRVIMVTGANEGIGKTLAMTLAEYGATLILMARSEEKLNTVSEQIIASGYHTPTIIPMNLESADYTQYQLHATTVEQQYGRLDGLVHNAGILGKLTTIDKYDPELWLKVMQVNFHSEFLLTRAFLSLLGKSHHASIIFTTSNLGIKGREYWGAYCASKFATEGFAQTLAAEEEISGSGIRVNTINPGRIRTNMRASAYPDENPETLSTPADIMPAYLYLMGRDSQHVNGSRINAQSWHPE